MSAELPSSDKNNDKEPDLDSILKRLSQIEHLVALLIIGFSAEDLTNDELEAWNAAVAWAYEDFDCSSLLETLPSPYEPPSDVPTFSPDQTTVPTEQQGTLFPAQDRRQSDEPK